MSKSLPASYGPFAAPRGGFVRRVAAAFLRAASLLLAERFAECGDDEEAKILLHTLAARLEDSTTRQVFYLRMRGASHRAVADVLGISEDAARQRWVYLRQGLLKSLQKRPLDE